MIVVTVHRGGRASWRPDESDHRRVPRTLGRREARRQHPRHGVQGRCRCRRPGAAQTPRSHLRGNCDFCRNCLLGASAQRRAAAGLGDLGRSVVPARVPGRAHGDHRASVPPHRVHPGRRPVVRAATGGDAGCGGQHCQRGAGPAAHSRGRLATEQDDPLPGDRGRRRPAETARLGLGAVHATDPGGAVLGDQLRSRRFGRAAGAVLHRDVHRAATRYRGGGDPRRVR